MHPREARDDRALDDTRDPLYQKMHNKFGVFIFVILIIINFSVVTKGAGRVAEVSARRAGLGLPGGSMRRRMRSRANSLPVSVFFS